MVGARTGTLSLKMGAELTYRMPRRGGGRILGYDETNDWNEESCILSNFVDKMRHPMDLCGPGMVG